MSYNTAACSNWCYWWLSHVILQSITMRFMPFRRCISL